MRSSMVTLDSVRGITKCFLSGSVSNSSVIPLSIGTCYLDSAEVPKSSVVFRVEMATADASPGSEAEIDIYDIHGVLNGGVPGIVTGSAIDTTTGSSPPPGPPPSPTTLSAYEVDLTTAFAGFAGAGVFQARLASLDDTTVVIATSAILIFR